MTWRALSFAGVLGLVGLMGGCAGPARLDALASREAVAVTTVRSPDEGDPMRIRNRAIGKDAGAGGVAGMVAGGMSGLGCGPWAFLCVPAGILVGGLTGSGVGAVVGLAAGLSAEQEGRLRARVTQAQQGSDRLEALREQVVNRLERAGHAAGAPGAVTTVSLAWSDVHFTLEHGEQVALVTTVLVSVQRADSKEPQRKSFTYASPLMSLAVWLDERNDLMETSLNTAVTHLASQLGAELGLR